MDWLEIKEFLKDSIKMIAFIAVVLFLFIYVISITQVVGNSMSPTLQSGEILLLNKLKYRLSDVKRGDIISLDYADTKYLIKRVIGLPGDTVSIRNSVVYINNEEYKEAYLSQDLQYADFSLEDIGYSVIPDNMYLVLGDNRVDSLDGRDIGLISKEEINGKISLRFWPLNKIKLF